MKKNIIKNNKCSLSPLLKVDNKVIWFKAFSMIEILIAIFVLSLWITSIYAIISSTLRINDYNKNYIIATNLTRWQIELVRNIRDSNYKRIKPYNLINPNFNNFSNLEDTDKFQFWKKYKIENDYSATVDFPIKIEDITNWFEEGVSKLNWTSMQKYRLCIDSENRYIYCSWVLLEVKTIFYKYISINKIQFKNWNSTEIINDSFKVTSKVIWYKRWYHEFEIKSIIADWKRL